MTERRTDCRHDDPQHHEGSTYTKKSGAPPACHPDGEHDRQCLDHLDRSCEYDCQE
jgi:hypothetical protein